MIKNELLHEKLIASELSLKGHTEYLVSTYDMVQNAKEKILADCVTEQELEDILTKLVIDSRKKY